jgi:hypothetical protein
MTKTLTKDKQGELLRLREQIAIEIEGAWTAMQISMEQVRRRHYHALGELFIQLRMTFDKGRKGDDVFVAYCKKHWPQIGNPQRQEYMIYRKRLGPVTSPSADSDLPPLRRVTKPNQNKRKVQQERDRATYGRIVDEEVEPEQFEIPRTKREVENELVMELAGKIINAGFRVLSVKLHPDKDGGSNDAMRRLNTAKQILEKALLHQSLRM